MGKLVKAEIFRMKRINSFWIFSLLLWLTALAIPFINHADSAITYFNGSLVSDGAVMFMMIALSAAFFTGRGYYHRTSMYEVMAGNSPIRIILSKILSIALPITLIIFIPHLIGLGVACGMNSDGIGDILKREPLFFLVCLRVSTFGVLLTMIVKSMGGTALVYVRLLIETFGLMIASSITGNDLMEGGADLVVSSSAGTILNNVCLSQQGLQLTAPLTGSVVLQIVLGFVGEVLLWGVISYIIYSKKDY